jgi:HI0933-like protein
MTGVKVSSVRKSSNSNGDECFTMNISTSKPIETIGGSLNVVPLGDVNSNSNSNRHTYRLAADYVLLATGSSREGHQWAELLGHTIESPVPSLFTLTIADSRIDGLAGVAVQVLTSICCTCLTSWYMHHSTVPVRYCSNDKIEAVL